MSSASLRGHIPALDGVRGVAILLVLLGHLAGGVNRRGAAVGPLLDWFDLNGWIGVDLFFVLSGFLITGILLDARGSRRYFRNFYARRSLRIFPLYYGVLLAAFVIEPLLRASGGIASTVGGDWAWFWLYGVNVLVPLRGHMFPLAHFWSLAVEEHFYLIWPAVVLASGRRALMAIGAILAVAAPAARAFAIPRWGPLAAYCLTPCRMDALAIGAFAAAASRGPGGPLAILPHARAVLATGLAVLLAMGWKSHGLPQFHPEVQVAGYSLMAATFGALVVVAAAARPGALTARLLDNAFLRSFGKYSYGIYVYHVFVMGAFARAVDATRPLGSAALLLYLASASGVALLVALLSWNLYERPFLKLKRFFPTEAGPRREARPSVRGPGATRPGAGVAAAARPE